MRIHKPGVSRGNDSKTRSGKRRRPDGWGQVPLTALTAAELRAVNRVLKTACAYVAYEKQQIERGTFTDVMDKEQKALHAAVDAFEAVLKVKKS